ncbi:MAG: dihydrolipoyl dehydrogenase [Spirochaetota bacterium]|nr:dihydrolipoyl dehydrogenase [Spirochaetota bacterium]
MLQNYDLLVLGAGPGGYVAAIRASQLKMKVAIIEKDKPGGVCLNIGCIPSKALIHQAELFRSINDLKALGVQIDLSQFDYSKVIAKSRKAADVLSKGVNYLLKKNNIDLIMGTGILTGKNEITLNDGKVITGKNIIISTGSKPKSINGFNFNHRTIISSTDALLLEKLPKSILILGAGAIGVEFAHIMNAFGVEVHLVEMLKTILPIEDQDTVQVLDKSFRKRGINILTSTKALSVSEENNLLKVSLEENSLKQVIEVEKMLVSVGRTANITDIGLANVGVEIEKGFIKVGNYYQTNVTNIYAVGDIINTPQLAHVASKEGEIAVEHLAGLNPEPKIDLQIIPSGTYCEPQIASFGYTEQKAKENGIPYKTVSFPYRGAGKSVAIEKSEGIVKILYSPDSKEIIGAHIVGAEATELIHEILLARSAELLPEDIAKMIHIHPTLSESIMEAMRAVNNWAIHI